MQRLLHDLAGHNLSAARDALQRMAEFEKSRSRPSFAVGRLLQRGDAARVGADVTVSPPVGPSAGQVKPAHYARKPE